MTGIICIHPGVKSALNGPRDTDGPNTLQVHALPIDQAPGRANAIWKQMLSEYEQPALDPAIDEALVAYAEKRRPILMAAAS